MAAPPDAPPSPTAGKIQKPVLLDKQPTTDDRQNATVELVGEISPPVFVNSEPIRDEQVQNAVKFLSHSKVRGSPVIYRRSFLEKKGLTKEEIDEAFRLVPDPTPVAATTEPVVMNQGGQMNSLSNVQQKAPAQIMQPTQIASTAMGTVSRKGTFSRFHWSHAIVAVGFLIVSGAGSVVFFKKTIIPRLKAWVRKVVMDEGLVKKNVKPSVAEEVTASAKAAATAAGDVSRTIQEMMISKIEEKRSFEELINMLNVQVQEMKSMSKAIQKLEGGRSSVIEQIAMEEQNDSRVHANSKQHYVNGKADTDPPRTVRSAPPPAPVQPSVAPHPKSYMEILNMIQRGEKPSNIREINDAPPNPNQPLSNPRLAPKPKPWEGNQANSNTTSIPLTQAGSNGSSHEFVYKQYNVDNPVPWWQPSNVRITEIEADNGKKLASSNGLVDERPPVQQSWVPPQPPPVAMPEAAAAILQPKKPAFQNEELTDNQLLARPPHDSSEIQKILKITESDELVEPGDGSLGLNLSEIRREETRAQIGSSD